MAALSHPHRHWQAGLLWPWFLGCVATVVAGRLAWAVSGVHGLAGFGLAMALLATAYGGAALLARLQTAAPAVAVAALFFLGIPFGLGIDAALDRLAGASQRELFPYELAIWSAYASLPVAVGMMLGGWLRSRA